MAEGCTEDWATESLDVGRGAYRIPGSERTLRSGDSIGLDYEIANVPRAADRLARSGVRLAAILEEVFKDGELRGDPVRAKPSQRSAVPAAK